jgi:hypothetical protein
MPDIQKADAIARRRACVTISIAAIVATAGVLLLEHYRPKLERLLEDKADFLLAHPEMIAAAFLVLMLPMYAGMFYLWRLGTATVAAERFPPPGKPVVRDTVILSGHIAVYRGRIIQALVLVLLLAGLSLPAVIWYIFWSLGRAA